MLARVSYVLLTSQTSACAYTSYTSRGIFTTQIRGLAKARIPGGSNSNHLNFVKEADRDASVILSSEQREILRKVLSGENVFFTGPSGTGKSLLLRKIIHELRSKGLNVAVTASTGISAINIEGGTLHAFSGIGLGSQHAPYLIKKAQTSNNKKRWCETNVLVIDEISMIDARIFDVVSEVGKVLRKNSMPFGGLQLVICGDFFQLPPVPDQICRDTGLSVSFAFEAKCWDQAVPTKISLTKIFRQKEQKLIEVLNEMRMGSVSDKSLAFFQSLARKIKYKDGIKPTEIFPLRVDAERANQKALGLLKGEQPIFSASNEYYKDAYGVYVHPQRGRSQLDRLIADNIELRIGAQVMSVKMSPNLPGTNIVNGSLGVVQGFLTLKEARDLPTFEDVLSGFDPKRRSGDKTPRLKQSIWESRRWPIVKFQDGTTLMITPYCFTHKNALGMVEGNRWQIPLILAWAITIHKAQGQTLSRIKIDLQGTFENGQAYVALSRCTSSKGLEVYNFSRDIVKAHPSVRDWHRTLDTIPDN